MSLIYYPNKLLSTPTEPINSFDETLSKELDEMVAIMLEYKGLGISANQCLSEDASGKLYGINKSMFIFKDVKNEIHKIINPKVVHVEGNVSISEGCLSYPSIYLVIVRPETIELEYQDVSGQTQKGIAYGMDARIILHEMDHLSGIDFLSHTNRATRKAAQSQLKKLLR